LPCKRRGQFEKTRVLGRCKPFAFGARIAGYKVVQGIARPLVRVLFNDGAKRRQMGRSLACDDGGIDWGFGRNRELGM
jgi:hypothetical protein